jgi:hypothetical protein
MRTTLQMVVGSTLRWYKKEAEFSVVQGLKGMATGERFLLDRGGGIDAQGDSVQVDMDGGAFQSGDTYLLLLKR